MIEVQNHVDILVENGLDVRGSAIPILGVNSSLEGSKLVNLEFGETVITVDAEDLVKAVRNATNV